MVLWCRIPDGALPSLQAEAAELQAAVQSEEEAVQTLRAQVHT